MEQLECPQERPCQRMFPGRQWIRVAADIEVRSQPESWCGHVPNDGESETQHHRIVFELLVPALLGIHLLPIDGNDGELRQDAQPVMERYRGMVRPLSLREREVLGHVAEGRSNKQIARSLAVSEQTIKNHVSSILEKLQANDRTHAVVLAMRGGLMSLEETSIESSPGEETPLPVKASTQGPGPCEWEQQQRLGAPGQQTASWEEWLAYVNDFPGRERKAVEEDGVQSGDHVADTGRISAPMRYFVSGGLTRG